MGNIYLGRVQNVLPSMEAAFVDIGKGRNAVLYAGEVNWDAAGLAGKARRIETALSGGDTVLVQVSKDPVGQKGARLTTQISLPGRFLVYVPGGGATGISRKLPDTERKRLKSILDRIVPSDAGVIIRTAAEGVDEEELARDVDRLKTQWEEISRQADKKSNAPLQLSAEPNTLIKVIRDLFNSDISRLVLDGDRAYEPVSAYINAVAPELANRVSRYDGPNDVFAAYRIDEQIAKALERKVYLPSGGSLVIDRTEAMTVVDVNTGKYTGSGGNLEETVTKNNLEAAEEVVRQLRLRDIGGIIVVDFIDMVLESNRELVMRRLTECLGRDRTRHQVAEVTSLGLIQMTRKKMGTGLVEAFSEPCPHCQGRGIILHDVPMEDRSGGQDSPMTTSGRPAVVAGKPSRGRPHRASRSPRSFRRPCVRRTRAVPSRRPWPGEEHLEHDDEVASAVSSDSSRFDTDPIFEPTTEIPSEVRPDDAAFNAPKSRDASDAVSAVLAALDAQAAARPPERQPIRVPALRVRALRVRALWVRALRVRALRVRALRVRARARAWQKPPPLQVLVRVVEIDLAGDGHSVVGDRRATELLVQHHVPTTRAESDLVPIGQLVDAALQRRPGLGIEADLLRHGYASPSSDCCVQVVCHACEHQRPDPAECGNRGAGELVTGDADRDDRTGRHRRTSLGDLGQHVAGHRIRYSWPEYLTSVPPYLE